MSGIEASAEGAKGHLVSRSGEDLILHLDQAFPPGRPLTVRVGDLRLDTKSYGSRKRGEVFVVKVRLRSIPRAARTALDNLDLPPT